jgi:two-component system NtrC family sensor kinase
MSKTFKRINESITAKLVVTTGILIITGSIIFWYAILQKQEKDMMSIAVKSGFSFIEYVKKSTRYNMLHFLRPEIQQMLEDISIAEDVESVRIFNHRGKIFYSTYREEIGKPIDRNSVACNGCHAAIEESSRLLSEPVKWTLYKKPDGYTALRLVEPIYNEPACFNAACHVHTENERFLGFVEADTSLALLDRVRSRQELALTAYVIIFILGISLSLVIILYKIVTHPVKELVSGMERVSAGDLDHPLFVKSRDEIGRLAEAFNTMTTDIKAARQKMQQWTATLEEEVAKKTEEIKKTHENLIQTEKLASLGRMAAGVAHEINNPLTGIVTFAHLLLKRVPPDSENAEDIKIIIEQAERCAKIINNLLTFARASTTEKGEVDINSILERAILMIRNQEKFQNIRFNLQIENRPFITVGEAYKYQQIFLNMLINASDAMNERGEITVATREQESEGKKYVEVEFTDTGSGISQQDMSKLFEPFFTTKPVGKGTGLGLSVSHGIVSQFGGKISVTSEVGKGTSFYVWLPLVGNRT